MTAPRIATLLAGGALLSLPSAAFADQLTLKFRLVTQPVEVNCPEETESAGPQICASRYVGVAIFEDGRLAQKTFAMVDFGGEAAGIYDGFSTYTWENGDSITAKFTGNWGSEGSGGDYTVLSGTGAYTGATGTGRFDKSAESWPDASLYDVTLTLDVPGT